MAAVASAEVNAEEAASEDSKCVRSMLLHCLRGGVSKARSEDRSREWRVSKACLRASQSSDGRG